MFFFKINIKDAVKLHLWVNSTTKSLILLNASTQGYLVYVSDSGTIAPQKYPINLETQSIALKTKEKCPFVAFSTDILYVFNMLDKGQNLTVWAQIVYPENIGLYIIVESYGPEILKMKQQFNYEIVSGYCTKTMVSKYFFLISSFNFNKCKSIMLIILKWISLLGLVWKMLRNSHVLINNTII